jgi:DnaJ-class molecular chaperone
MKVNDLEVCPRRKGAGADAAQTAKPGAGEVVSVDRCRSCGGSGRVRKQSAK